MSAKTRKLRGQFLRALDHLIDSAKSLELACNFLNASAEGLRGSCAPDAEAQAESLKLLSLGLEETRNATARFRRQCEHAQTSLRVSFRELDRADTS